MLPELVSPPLGVRGLARAVDAAVVTALTSALGAVIGFGSVWLVVGAVGIVAYFVVCDVVAGATLGKRFVAIRVVGPDGKAPGVLAAVVREAFTAVGAVPFVGPLLAMAAWAGIAYTASNSPAAQGLHDRLAGTRVVYR